VLSVKGATLSAAPGKAAWLLACEPSRTWVAYQPNPDVAVPVALECPAGRLTCEGLPFGKVSVTQKADGSVWVDADAEPFAARLETRATQVGARVSGAEGAVANEGQGIWTIRGK
jgi:hypothetical protein